MASCSISPRCNSPAFFPFAKDDHAVGALPDLAQPVRDIDDRDALVAKVIDDLKEPLCLGQGQAGGGLHP